MAVAHKKMGKGMFGLFSKDAEQASAAVNPAREASLQGTAAMVPLLVAVLEEKRPVRLMLDKGPFWYYSYFEPELLESESGLIMESHTYLEEGQYLLLAPLDPPIGNLKIRNASDVHLELTSKFHLMECVTSLDKITPSRKIRLVFPKSMRQKAQQRLAVRVPVARNMPIVVSVSRPSGIAFEARFRDISTGGASFCSTGAIPKIADHARVDMEVTYPGGTVTMNAMVVGSFPKDGEHIFRAQFLVADQKTSRNINALVSYVQWENISRRKKTLR